MNHLSSRTRIVLGQGCLLVSVLIAGVGLGFAPDHRAAVADGRAALCEAIALQGSVLISRHDLKSLEAALKGVVQRNGDILSAAVRRADGRLAVEVGDHASQWRDIQDDRSIESQVQVPLRVGEQKWGSIELRFQPLAHGGIRGLLASPWTRFVAFVTAATVLTYLVYLGKVLEQLDPSKVVPGRVRNALNTLTEGLLVLDKSGRIVLANEAFARLVGRTPDKPVGFRASRLPWVRSDTDSAPAIDPWVVALEEQRPLANVAMRLRAHDGEEKTFAANCSPVLGHDGNYRGVLASFDDVTQLEHHKRELSTAKEAAESANRAKSDFLARMSHEIRTPMNAILGFTDVLRRGFDCDEQERLEYLNTIRASGQHLLDLINDILDLSKVEAGKLEVERARCSPIQVISEVVSVLRVRAQEKGIALDSVVSGEVPETILSDATRLRQMLMNLVGNAIKFTAVGGVKVAARLDRTRSEPQFVIEVIDTGIGIAPEAINTIFEPFAQADTSITRRFGGTGLGLTICRRFADALGGELSVHSELGAGSVFTISLPTGPLDGVRIIDAGTAARSATTRPVQAESALKLPPARILAVDDGPENRKLLALVLRRAGAAVETATNGQEAVQLATSPGAPAFDVILMDVEMPVMDGYTAATTLRTRGVSVPIIALTAHAMKGDAEKCKAAGFSGYLTKPIDMDQLISTLSEELGAPESEPHSGGESLADPSADDREHSTQIVDLADFIGAPVSNSSFNPEPQATAASHPTERPALVSTLPTDDPEFLDIVREFVQLLHQRLEVMDQAWSARDLPELARLAHWLKGSGGTAGFAAFGLPAQQLERLAKAGACENIDGALAELHELASRIVIAEDAAVASAG